MDDQPIDPNIYKKYEEIRKSRTAQGEDYDYISNNIESWLYLYIYIYYIYYIYIYIYKQI